MSEEIAVTEETVGAAEENEGAEEPQLQNDDYEIDEPDDDFEIGADGANELDVPVADDGRTQDVKIEKNTGPEKKETAGHEVEKIPDELAERAKDAGLSDDDIKDFTQSQLEKVVSLVRPEKETAETKERTGSHYDSDEFKVELDPDIYDPQLCKVMGNTASQINGIKSQLNNISAVMQRQSTAEFERNFEGMINGLDESFTETLGRGTASDIGKDSEQFANRCRILDEMNALAVGYSTTGRQLPSGKQLFERAVNSVFSDKLKSNVRKTIASQLDRRASQIISRPGSRSGADKLTPERRAASVVAQKLREYGADEDSEIEEDF